MKLNELFESFNSELPVKWTKNGTVDNGYFSLDDRDYKIEIIHNDINELGTDFEHLIEVSFKGKNKEGSENDYSYQGTKDNNASHAATIFGTVLNSVKKRIDIQESTIVYFSAKKNDGSFESRRKMYRMLSRILSKRFDIQWNLYEHPNFEVYFLSKKALDKELIKNTISMIV